MRIYRNLLAWAINRLIAAERALKRFANIRFGWSWPGIT